MFSPVLSSSELDLGPSPPRRVATVTPGEGGPGGSPAPRPLGSGSTGASAWDPSSLGPPEGPPPLNPARPPAARKDSRLSRAGGARPARAGARVRGARSRKGPPGLAARPPLSRAREGRSPPSEEGPRESWGVSGAAAVTHSRRPSRPEAPARPRPRRRPPAPLRSRGPRPRRVSPAPAQPRPRPRPLPSAAPGGPRRPEKKDLKGLSGRLRRVGA